MTGSVAEWAFAAAWCLSAGLISAVITYAIAAAAARLGLLDEPNERSSHVRPTPRGGGIGIVATCACAVVVAWSMGVGGPAGAAWLLVAAFGIAMISLLDDVTSVSHRLRLAAHVLAAMLAVLATGPYRQVDLGSLGTLDLGPAAWPLSIIWIVGMTNAFNFMDGIDGIAGIMAAVAMAVLAGGFALAGEGSMAGLSTALAAAAAGFLVWNWHPARIFMGDVGSAFLGFLIASLPLLGSPPTRAWLLAMVALVMWPFLFDTVFTLLRRLGRGENVFEAHRSHLYQRLVICGWSHRVVAILYGALGGLAGAAGLAARAWPADARLLDPLAATFVVASAIGLVLLVHGSEARLPCRTAS